MPVVKIDLWEGRTLEEKDSLIRGVTEAVCKAIKVKPKDVIVILNEVHRDHWGVGGKRSSTKK
jgi:4-oxalocrotonate tautomerase